MLDYKHIHSSGERILKAFPVNKKVWNKTKKTAKRTFVLWTAFAPDWAIVLVWLIVGIVGYSLPVLLPFAVMDAPYSIMSSLFAVFCLCVFGTHYFFFIENEDTDGYFAALVITSLMFGFFYFVGALNISPSAFWRCLFFGFVAILTNCVLHIHVVKKYKRLSEEKRNREISLLTRKGWFTDLLYRKEDFEEKRITFLGRELTLRQAEYEFKKQDVLYQRGEPECNIEELANLGEELSEMLLEEEAIQKLDKYQDKLIKKYSAEIDNRTIIMPDWVADEDGSLYLPKPPARFQLNSACKLTQEEAVALYVDAVSNYENGIPTGLTDSEFDALEYYVTGKSQVVELDNKHDVSGDYENYSEMQWDVLEKTYPEAASEVEWFNEEFQIPSLNPIHRGVKKSTNKDKIYRWLKYNSGAIIVPKYDGFWCRIWFKNGQIVSCRTKKETITDWVKSNIHFEDTDFTGCITGELVIFHEEAEIMRIPNTSRSQGKHPFWNLREYLAWNLRECLASRMNGNNTIEYGELKIAIHRPRKELPDNLPTCIYHESHTIPNCESLREYIEVDDFVGRKANYCQDGWVLYSFSGRDCLAYKIDSSHF